MGAVRVASLSLRIAGVLALFLGLELLSGSGGWLVPVHVVLGLVVVVALWALGLMQARLVGGSKALAGAALLVGLLLPIVGLGQTAWFSGGGRVLTQLVHVVFGFAAIGVGEVCAGRLRRSQEAPASPAAP